MSSRLFIFICIIFLSTGTVLKSLADQCGTPVECYAQAIDTLNRDRQEMARERDSYIKTLDQLNNKIALLEDTQNELLQKLASLDKKENDDLMTTNSELNNMRNNHICRTLETPCSDDGSGNMIYLDRHNLECWSNEQIQSFHLERCSSHTIKYVYNCCRLP
jgi:hypothetical protein